VKHLSSAPLKGRPLALTTNIRLGWKGLPGTNTPAYYEKSVNYGCKKLYRIGPRLLSLEVVNFDLRKFIGQPSTEKGQAWIWPGKPY
jgi:hypothetical protein